LRIVDVSHVAAPVQRGIYATPGKAKNVTVAGNYAYVADDYVGLQVADVSNPALPIFADFSYTAIGANDTAVSGNYAYVADKYTGLEVIDVSNPAAPVQIGHYRTTSGATGIVLIGDTAYVTTYSDLSIIAVSDPTAPTEIGFFDIPGRAWSVAVVGDYAYLAADFGLRVLDVSNPSAPLEIGFYGTSGPTRSVTVAGNYAYVGGEYNSLQVVDVSNPTTLTKVGACSSDYIYDIIVAGNQAYAAASGGLRMLNISNPTTPVEIGFYTITGHHARGVTVANDEIYVAFNEAGLIVLRYVETSHYLSGQVTDAWGNPLAGVQVSAGATYSATTDDRGVYLINDLPADDYSLTPTLPGYFYTPAQRNLSVPPSVVGQDFVAQNIHKQVQPSSANAVNYGQPLSYTINLIQPHDQTLALYDPLPTYTTYISGSLTGPAGISYDQRANAISGALRLDAAVPATITFAVRVAVTGTAGLAPTIINRACARLLGSTASACQWSNQVLNFSYVWPVYMPVVMQ
jgi:hypothetical protein